MPKKEPSPLQLAQKAGDILKKKVDKLLSECQSTLKKKQIDQKKYDDLNKRCIESANEVIEMTRKVEQLKPEKEPVPIPLTKFDTKKQDELKRLNNLKEQISSMTQKLFPTPESIPQKMEDSKKTSDAGQPVKNAKKAVKIDDEEENDDEDEDEDEDDEDDEDVEDKVKATDEDDDEDEEDEEEEEEENGELEGEEEEEEEEEEVDEENGSHPPGRYVSVGNFRAEQEGDLSLNVGDILQIVKIREDGWWEAINSQGAKGMVPKNYLEPYKHTEDVEEDDEEDEEEEEEEEENEPAEVEETPRTPRTGRELWNDVKKSVKTTTSVTDVLQTLGSLPAGFRESTLAKRKQSDVYSMRNFLTPKLSHTCLSYRDLLLNHQTGKVRSKEVPVQRIVNVVCCQQMPVLSEGLEVRSRHVRACLFDGQNVLSNIVFIRVSQVEKDQKTWNYSSKPDASCLDFAEFFIRTDLPSTNLGILFETCVTYIRLNTSEEAEASCGWTFLKLYDQKLSAVSNKTYEELINGGTPYEKGIDVDPTVGRRGTGTGTGKMLRSLMAINRQPKLTVRLAMPTKEQKELLDTLPDTIIGSTSHIQYMSLYRQILADSLLRDRHDLQSTELIHCPVAATLPDVMEQPDLLDVLRGAWAEQLKAAKNKDKKKDTELLKSLFVTVYMESVYPLHFLSTLRPLKITDAAIVQERFSEVQRVTKLSREKGFSGAVFLVPDVRYKPFNTSEVALDVVGPYSTNVLTY